MGRRGHRGRHGHRGSAPPGVAPDRAAEHGPGGSSGLAPGDVSSNGTGAANDGRSADIRPGFETITVAAVRNDAEPTVELTPREALPDGGQRNGATLPQLRRFIKSRPYIPMHELRRRFALSCEADDVHAIDAGSSRLYVGLPEREAGFLGELIRSGEIGYELLLDPCSPLVIGVYAMRPVGRA